jgi:hypothetical protein
MEAVVPMAAKYGISSIFLATDDHEVVRATAKYPQFHWLYVPGIARGDDQKILWEDKLRSSTMDNFAEVQSALVDLLLLAEGDAFVGKFTSNLDRIAYALLSAGKRGLAPYVSLDSTWCMDWGSPVGTSIFGKFMC